MKKIDKSLIISKTFIFLFVVAFVVGFKSIFGEENTLIGVTTITATLMFLSRDLTATPVKNTFKLIILNLLMGIGAYFAVQNIFVGLVINFVMLFVISYLFSYNLKEPMYLAFSLQYLFILSVPVGDDKIGIRLVSLIFGAVFIMLAQILANKNKLSKAGNKLLCNVCDSIIDRFYDNKVSESNDKLAIEHMMDDFRSMIYDKSDPDSYITEEARIKLGISVALENIFVNLYNVEDDSIDEEILSYLKEMLGEVKNILSNKSHSLNGYDIEKELHELVKDCGTRNIKNICDLKLLDSMVILADSIDTLNSLAKDKYNSIRKCTKDFSIVSKETASSLSFGSKSIRFCYAMRVAVSISISALFMDLFNISEGRWLLFTLLSLTTPLYEISKSKIYDRTIATLIGSGIVLILFTVIKDAGIRTMLILLNGYIGGYFPKYKHNMIFVTISAIGSAAVLGDLHILTANRVLLVGLGAGIALFSNEYLFPYKLNDSNKQLKSLHNEIMENMVKELNLLLDGEKRPIVIKNLFILTSLIESKCRVNAQLVNDYKYVEVLKERRYLATNIYELYMWVLNEDINKEYAREDILKLKEYLVVETFDLEAAKLHIEEEIQACDDMNTRIVLSSVLDIVEEITVLHDMELEEAI